MQINSKTVQYAASHPPFDDYLYGDMSKEKYDTISFLYALPGFHELIDWRMDARRSQEYLDRYGMSWEDVHDFRRLYSFGSQSRFIGYSLNWIGRNIGRLYK